MEQKDEQQLDNLGVWIPKVISENKELLPIAKLIYGFIHGFTSNGKKCWATNRKIGQWVGCEAKHVSECISILVEQKLISSFIDKKSGNQRILSSIPLYFHGGVGSPPAEGGVSPNGGGHYSISKLNSISSSSLQESGGDEGLKVPTEPLVENQSNKELEIDELRNFRPAPPAQKRKAKSSAQSLAEVERRKEIIATLPTPLADIIRLIGAEGYIVEMEPFIQEIIKDYSEEAIACVLRYLNARELGYFGKDTKGRFVWNSKKDFFQKFGEMVVHARQWIKDGAESMHSEWTTARRRIYANELVSKVADFLMYSPTDDEKMSFYSREIRPKESWLTRMTDIIPFEEFTQIRQSLNN
jgi:hypothetical protein